MLTGGNTVKDLYIYWANNFKNFNKYINFFITDERDSLPRSKNNNGFMIERLFINKIKLSNLKLHKYNTKLKNKSIACKEYSKKINGDIDILILSLGEGGHIASIFQENQFLMSKKKLIEYTKIKSTKQKRFTITPRIINKSKSIFLLCIGYSKGAILKSSLRSKNSVINSIKKINKTGIWVLDKKAKKSFYEK